jgi:hypothetical protein
VLVCGHLNVILCYLCRTACTVAAMRCAVLSIAKHDTIARLMTLHYDHDTAKLYFAVFSHVQL